MFAMNTSTSYSQKLPAELRMEAIRSKKRQAIVASKRKRNLAAAAAERQIYSTNEGEPVQEDQAKAIEWKELVQSLQATHLREMQKLKETLGSSTAQK